MKDKFNTLFMTALPRQGKRALLLITLVAIPVLLLFLGRSELLNNEGDWASCARLMLGDGLIAHNWQTANCHTAIYARLITELARFFPISEWLIRLPSVLAALAALAGTILLALEIFERKNAVLAGWLMLGSYGFLYWGRIGSGSMFAAAATVWCAALFYGRQRRKSSPFRSSFDFFVILLTAWVLCGYTAALGIILLLLPQWYDMGKKRQFSLRGSLQASGAALSAFLLVAVILYIVIYSDNPSLRWDGNLIRMGHFCRRLSANSFRELIFPAGHSPVETLLNLPRLLLPWSLLIPAVAVGLWKKRKALPGDLKKLLLGMLLYVLVLGIFPCRRWGAILPLLGPAVIVIATGLSARYHDPEFERRNEIVIRGIFIVIAALFVALFCTWPLWGALLRVRAPQMLMLLSLLGGGATLMLLTFGIVPGSLIEKIMKRPSPLAGTVLAGVILSILVNCVLFPQMNRFRTGKRFWQSSAIAFDQCEPAPEIVMFYRCGLSRRGIYYLSLDQPFAAVDSPQQADEILQNCGGKVAVISWNSPEIIAELTAIAAKNRKRFTPGSPLAAEELPVAFINSDARSAEKGYAAWLLEL